MSLTIQSMNVGYRNRPVISDICLPDIAPGSLVAVVGSNAVGKSTLLKSLAGLLKYTGNVNFDAQPMVAMTQSQRMKTIGYLPQTLPQATTLVAYELVYSACRAACPLLSKSEVDERIETVFARLGIRDFALRKMQEMSGGQRQMVGLAQVLVRQPQLLLLDEPTSALDLHWQLNVLQAIKEETSVRQAIAFVASHDLNLSLRFCDQVLILARGGVLAMGQPEQALTPERLQTAYGVQGRVERCSKGYPIVLADRAV